MKKKLCKSCKTLKCLEEFYNRSKAKNGKQDICKECSKAKWRELYRINPVKFRERHHSKIHQMQWIRRAQEYGVAYDNDITIKQLYVRDGGICQICRQPCH